MWFAASLLASAQPALARELPVPRYGAIKVAPGVRLHYAEAGRGPVVIFVHGSISDYTYWDTELETFGSHYRAIAYSRRYNFPNDNPPVAGYSALTDADDLAAFIRALHAGPVFIVGHSYGALTGLILTAKHPELVRAAVLAEAPAVSLLRSEPVASSGGVQMFDDIERKMVVPMRRDFTAHHDEEGIDDFVSYVFGKPSAWSRFSLSDKADTLRDAREWEVMMPSGELFPDVSPNSLRRIHTPILLLSGGKSYPFLAKIDAELLDLIPSARRVVFPNSGHQMWYTDQAGCINDTMAFFAEHGGPPAT